MIQSIFVWNATNARICVHGLQDSHSIGKHFKQCQLCLIFMVRMCTLSTSRDSIDNRLSYVSFLPSGPVLIYSPSVPDFCSEWQAIGRSSEDLRLARAHTRCGDRSYEKLLGYFVSNLGAKTGSSFLGKKNNIINRRYRPQFSSDPAPSLEHKK